MKQQLRGPRFGSPESYTPTHLAERILTSKSALEGERKLVTVLFADIKGSMELVDGDPEEARTLLDPVLERMMEAVHHYEGTVNQVMGDGIMALFGAPIAHEDHAVRACYAALRMQHAIKRYAEELSRGDINIRVGLNSGHVVVRAIANDLHMEYTAIGQTTHLAARMEQIAGAGTVLLTPATLKLVEGLVAVRALGPVPVKGLAESLPVYELTGVGPARTKLQAAAGRGLTDFVGRATELEQLRRCDQLVRNGRGQVAAIVGEAGVGKSRLVYEFMHSHNLQGWRVLEGAAVSYGKATSYLPVIEALKSYFEVQERDGVSDIRDKVTRKVVALDASLRPTLPALLALFETAADDESWRALEPLQRRERMLEAVTTLLVRESREQPLLLIVEDLHWIDGESQAVLDALVDRLGSTCLFLLVNYRREYRHAWDRKPYYNELRLDALPPQRAGELLDLLLGHDPGLTPLKQVLVKRGNPFFLEESIRGLVETNTLTGERGHYRLGQPPAAIQVPPTVQAVLAARIDRLTTEDKRLLRVASVVGKDISFVLLRAIADLPDDALRRGLECLQSAEFLYEIYPDLEYSFKHALTHEVTYGGLLHDRRRALHARITEAVESLYADRLAEHVEQLAHHALHGELWEKAVTYSGRAGAKALARSAYREAATCFERAIEALKHLPESRDTTEQAIDLRLNLRISLFQLREFRLDLLQEAETLARAIGDRKRLGVVCGAMSAHFWVTDDQDRARDFGERALQIAEQLDDQVLRAEASSRLGLVYHALGDYRRAIAFLRNALALLGDDFSGKGLTLSARFSTPPWIVARVWLVSCLSELGYFTEATSRAEEAVRIAEALQSPVGLIGALHSVGFLYLRKGDFDKVIPALERGVEVVKAMGIPVWLAVMASNLGAAYALSGRINDALPALELGAAQRSERLYRPLQLVYLSEAYLLAGRIEESLEVGRRALELSRAHKEPGHEAFAHRLLGEIASHRDPPDKETGHTEYCQALALATNLGMRPLVAHCHLGLGRLYRRTGKPDQAREHLTAATTMYREMEMTYWLEKVEGEIKGLASDELSLRTRS